MNKLTKKQLTSIQALWYNSFSDTKLEYYEPKHQGETEKENNAWRQYKCKVMNEFIYKPSEQRY